MTAGRRIAIIGAGLGGLTCATELQAAGHQVQVFEKSRGVGGRMATRRADVDGVALAFDHGAQYFTARDSAFVAQVERWQQDGVAQLWNGRIGVLEDGVLLEKQGDATARWVATPTMTAVAKQLAAALPSIIHQRVVCVSPRGGDQGASRWRLVTEHQEDGEQTHDDFDIVLSNAPAPQTAELFDGLPLAAECLQSEVAPCWALMAAFPDRLDVPFDGVFINDHPVLSWASRNNTKPGRPAPECWVAHASGDWSSDHEWDPAEEALASLQQAFAETLGAALRQLPKPLHVRAHRWRFALPTKPLEPRCLWDPQQSVGACGDWCGGPRVEGAFLSGQALARRVLESMTAA